ncbi:MAG: sulfite exporter TauE/SafE family protein [Pseudoxanthomonas sp.]
MPIDWLVLGAALAAGTLGSVHCAAMCGGIATGICAAAPARGWWPALQANLGRIGGYVIAGALVGGIGGGVLRVLRIDGLALGLRMAAGGVLVLVALRLFGGEGRFNFLSAPGARLWQKLQPLRRLLLPADNGWRRFGVGLLWGWLPCGLSLGLLTTAWLQGNARDAALTMAAFGIGTLPVMLPLTWSGARLTGWLRRSGWRHAAAGLVLLSGLLTLAAPWLVRVPGLHGALTALGCGSVPT